jgi:hypothetical protein
LETKLIAARQITVGRSIPNKNDIRPAGKAGFYKTDTSRLGPSCAHRYAREDIAV